MANLLPEPWLQGTHTELDVVARQIVHALELTAVDADRWCAALTEDEVNARPFGLEPVAFHLRHIARSLDRLLSYAEGRALSEQQLEELAREFDPGTTAAAVMEELRAALVLAKVRVCAIPPSTYGEARAVGRARLVSTVGGLLVHCAEHTQRHSGQAITTAKLLVRMRAA